MNIFEKHQSSDSNLPFIFHDHHYPKLGASRNNWHENIELLCILQGSVTIVINGQTFFAGPGDIAIVDKNAMHFFRATTDAHCFCLIIDHAFCVENHFDVDSIHFSPLVRNEELFDLINRFAEIYSDQSKPHRLLELHSLLLSIALLLCRQHCTISETPHEETRLFNVIKQVIEYIHTECHNPLTLNTLSSVAGINKDYLSRSFHKITGYTITAYINLERCEKAKQLLKKTSKTIEAVAQECGFENVSYFSRTFLSITGVRPGEYRKKHLKPSTDNANRN